MKNILFYFELLTHKCVWWPAGQILSRLRGGGQGEGPHTLGTEWPTACRLHNRFPHPQTPLCPCWEHCCAGSQDSEGTESASACGRTPLAQVWCWPIPQWARLCIDVRMWSHLCPSVHRAASAMAGHACFLETDFGFAWRAMLLLVTALF